MPRHPPAPSETRSLNRRGPLLTEERARRAREYGADIVLNPVECNVVEEIMKLTGGLGCDVYVEASGSPKSAVDTKNCA